MPYVALSATKAACRCKPYPAIRAWIATHQGAPRLHRHAGAVDQRRCPPPPTEVAFTPSVKAVQPRRGSRAAYARMEEKGGFATADRSTASQPSSPSMRSFYLATANRRVPALHPASWRPQGLLARSRSRRRSLSPISAGNRQYIYRRQPRRQSRAPCCSSWITRYAGG